MDARISQSTSEREYLPGFGLGVLLPLYDPMHRLVGLGRLHAEMVRHAGLSAGQRVLDVGCGTGNLLLQLGSRRPDLALTGLDPDPRALARARRKARRAGVDVALDHGFAQELPYPDATFDRVFSSLMLHHLDPAAKDALLGEVRRVLRPDGALVLADFDSDSDSDSETGHGHGHGFAARRMARSRRLRDNTGLRSRIAAEGFTLAPPASHQLRMGRIEIVRAQPDRT